MATYVMLKQVKCLFLLNPAIMNIKKIGSTSYNKAHLCIIKNKLSNAISETNSVSFVLWIVSSYDKSMHAIFYLFIYFFIFCESVVGFVVLSAMFCLVLSIHFSPGIFFFACSCQIFDVFLVRREGVGDYNITCSQEHLP